MENIMFFVQKIILKNLTKKAIEQVMAEVSFVNGKCDQAHKKMPSMNDAIQVAHLAFMKRNNISPEYPPSDNAFESLTMYVFELLRLKIPTFGSQEEIEIMNKIIQSWANNS